MENFYSWFINIVGELPSTPNTGEMFAYSCACIICCYVIYTVFNLVLTLFRWIWGK